MTKCDSLESSPRRVLLDRAVRRDRAAKDVPQRGRRPRPELNEPISTSSCSARSPCSAATYRARGADLPRPRPAHQRSARSAPRGRGREPGADAASSRCEAAQASGRSSSRPRPRRSRLSRRCSWRTSASTRREPHLEKLLAAEGVTRERIHAANRLLAANPDKAANLRVVRTLASRHPELPQAHFAVAQAAAAAGDDAAALTAIRPRKRAAARLGARRRFSRRRSCSSARPPRPPRSSAISSPRIRIRARRGSTTRALLILDKRLPEARKQFEAAARGESGEHRSHLCRGPARVSAQGLRGRRSRT